MGRSFRIGKVFGIPIYLHYTWLIIFAWLTWVICSELLPDDYPLGIRIAGGVLTSLLFFACVIAHELSHSFVAIKKGISVKGITLFFLGGVAQITREPRRPRDELFIALAGPLCSFVLGGVFLIIWFLVWGTIEESINPIWWLAFINLWLGLFNLLPGFPMDGGRVLRALLWWGTGNYRRSTHIASLVGKGVAWLLIIGGIAAMFISRDLLLFGLMLAFVGWLIHHLAGASYRQAELMDALRGFVGQDVMTTDYLTVPPDLSLRELAQSYIFPTGRQYFVVATEGRLEGIIAFHKIKKVPQPKWVTTPVSAVMTPVDRLISVPPDEDALNILEQMLGKNLTEILVVKEGRVMGIVTQDRLLRFPRLRAELGMWRKEQSA